ncbi:MAG: hypothetical protein ABIG95_00785 [Candidatus Woesearchaeota archaeon]
MNYKIMNSKEVKQIKKLILEQWGAEIDLATFAVLKNNRDKIFLISRHLEKVDYDELRINNLGLYLGTVEKGELRLSIEGSQLIGPKAQKNVVELPMDQIRLWFRGEDIMVNHDSSSFVILKHDRDFLGSGKIAQGKLHNYIPKARRVELV